jgi:hypothetical protein
MVKGTGLRVTIRRGVWMLWRSKVQRMGCFAHRYVEASSSKEAATLAEVLVIAELRPLVKNEAGELWTVRATEVRDGNESDAIVAGQGFTWFDE